VALTVPNGLSGTYYVIADADSGDAIYEIDLSSKIAASTSTISVSSQPADLVVSSFSAPAQLQAGTIPTLSWTVTNQGTGDTIATTWNDAVYASASSNLSSPVLLGTFAHQGLLEAGQSYSTTEPVPIPISLSGTYYLFVTTNPATIDQTTNQPTYAVYESNYANDSSTPVTVTVNQSLADLVVTQVAAPSALETGQSVTITWTTANVGTGTTNANSWYDDVWMSTTADVNEGGIDVYLGSYYRSNSLAAGQSYNASATVTIPQTLTPGTYYIIVRADRPSQVPTSNDPTTVRRVYQSSYANSDTASSAITVTAGPAPDLAVTAVSAPPMAIEDQPITVSWTVANDDASTSQSWNDAVYLSLDTSFDPTSNIYLGYSAHTGGLASGQSYTQQATFNVPAGLTGNYYVVVVANSGNTVFETSYTNDVAASAQPTSISLTPPADLVAGTITIPANAVPGEDMTFSYTVTNQGSNNAVGQWTDSLYLSPTTSFVYTDPLLATNVHQGGLAASQSYTDQITAPVPGITPGTYYVILRTDVLNQIPESNQSTQVSASLSGVLIDAPALTLATAQNGTLGQGQSAYYKVIVTSGQTLQVSFDSQESGSLNELFVSFGTMPSQSQSDYHYTSLAANQQITVPATQAGTYYILAYGSSVPTAPESYSITAAVVPFAVESAAPGTVGTGTDTIEIDGSKFDNNTTFQLLGPDGTVLSDQSVYLQDSSTAFVTFNLTGMPTGTYTVQAAAGNGTTAQLMGALTVVPATPASVQVYLSYPNEVLPGSEGVVTVNYTNESNTDALAPLLQIGATYALLRLQDQSSFTSNPLWFLGISANGPAGTLRPDESGQIAVPYQVTGTVGQQVLFDLESADDSQPMDWASQESALQLPTIADAAWPAVFANFVANVGSTVLSYHTALANDATYLSQLGETTYDVLELVSFEIEKANAGFSPIAPITFTDDDMSAPGMNLTFTQTYQPSISGRYTLGILGYGWTTNWDISATTMTNGDVTVDNDGGTLYYTLQSDGSYQDSPLDHSVLTLANGAYTLTRPDGTIYQFNANGTLAYVQDSNGNRITASYNTGGQLVTLTHSNGEYLTLTYNAQGRLSRLVDSNGQAEAFGYDATGQFLTSYTCVFGTSTLSYINGQDAQQNNALAEIDAPNGTDQFLSYDSEGRPVGLSENGGAQDESFTYLSPGGYMETDAKGDTSTILYNIAGTAGETIDALGNVTVYKYDASMNLIEVDGPQGNKVTYTYDANGNLTSTTDPLGNTTKFTYDSSDNLTSYTDAQGNTTAYSYNSSNNLMSITYASGAQQQFTYNPLGESTQFLNADGDAIGYVYNANGLVTKATFADGSSYAYTYDQFGNMTSATDAQGHVTTFVYGNSSNPYLLTEVEYPDGTFLTFSYNVIGDRTQSIDQTGFTVNYTYNSLGELSELTDGNGNLIVKYVYDSAGLLVQKDMGNGT